MDGKGNRGAYAQVTAPIGDDAHVTVNQGGKSSGASAFCTSKRCIILAVLLVAVIIVIILLAVLVPRSKKAAENVQGTTLAPSGTSEMVSARASLSPSSMSDAMTTTTQPPVVTTYGPAEIGSFQGSLVLEKPYEDSFDDAQLIATRDLMTNVSDAITQVFDANAPYMFVSTAVDQLLKNGTNVAARFTVSVDAINRGASSHLKDVIGPVPSTALNTYRVLIAEIGPEEPPQTNA